MKTIIQEDVDVRTTKAERDKDLKDIYYYIDNNEFRIKFDWIPKDSENGCVSLGCATIEDVPTITINIYDLVNWTVLHEILHYVRPEIGDKNSLTDKYAGKILAKMTQGQRRKLYKKVSKWIELPPSNRIPIVRKEK